MPPAQMALMAWRASSMFAARTTGTIPISLIRLIVSSRAKRPLLVSLFHGSSVTHSWISRGICHASHLDRSSKASIGIDEEPGHRTKGTQKRSGKERGVPPELGGNNRRERSGDRATQLRTHVHKTRGGPGTAPGNIGGNRPIGALREVQRTGASGENHAGKADACRARTKNQKNGRQKKSESGDAATAGTLAVGF